MIAIIVGVITILLYIVIIIVIRCCYYCYYCYEYYDSETLCSFESGSKRVIRYRDTDISKAPVRRQESLGRLGACESPPGCCVAVLSYHS